MADWGASGNKETTNPSIVPKVIRKKWEGEDEAEDDVASDWEESSEEEDSDEEDDEEDDEDEDEKPKVVEQAVPPPKKKGSLQAKLAEKEAAKAAAGNDDDIYDSDDVLDPREKARRAKEKELNADLSNAADLLGAAALGGTDDKELDKLVSANPRTKEDFEALSTRIVEYIIKRHQNKPLYAAFVEHHVKELAMPLKDVEVRKVASGLTTLANEKQKEQRDKAGGKKKAKTAAKPTLGVAKAGSKLDTTAYTESLDDFADDDFFM